MRKRSTGVANTDLLQVLGAGQPGLALELAQAALRQRPADGKLWQLMGVAQLQLGRPREAEAVLRRAAELRPGDAEIRDNLVAARQLRADELARGYAQALAAQDPARALRLAQEATVLDANRAAHHGALSAALAGLGRIGPAIDAARRAVALAPDAPDLHRNLASLLRLDGQLQHAIASYRQVLQLLPGDVEARRDLAYALAGLGRLADAVDALRGDQPRWPQDLALFSQQLFYRATQDNVLPHELFEDHVEYGRRATAQARPAGEHGHDRQPERRLRLGFVSADLYDHPVAGFIEPVWAALQTMDCEVWAYANGRAADAMTARLRALCTGWHDTAAWDDAELAARIQADRIDVLFDLSGHTAGHRLSCFAMKPAPVQVTWIGYPNTTGLPAMDYALCDRFNAPPGLYEAWYTEKFARIPCSGTFRPPQELPAVRPLPALACGHVVFGSFNHPRKIGTPVLQAWARVLHAVPGSRLLIGYADGPDQIERLTDALAGLGIEPSRLRFEPPMSLADYLALHHQVDLMLDSWPYTGGTTTNYALAMGVPVLTRQGPGRAHCQSAGVLGRIGLQDWVARDEDEFVAIARRWALDLPALARLRVGLRARWQDTPRRQPVAVAHGLMRAVRLMWQRWCAGLPPEHLSVDDDAMAGPV